MHNKKIPLISSIKVSAALSFLFVLTACVTATPVAVPASEFPKIEPISAATPRECAGFVGGWTGEWTNGNFGPLRLWVTKVTDTCQATYTYSGRDGAGKISNGTLSVPCGGGTCNFSISGESLYGTYSQSFSQKSTFVRIIQAK